MRSTFGVDVWASAWLPGTLAISDDAADSGAQSMRPRVPQLLTQIRYPAKFRSTPDRRSVKADRRIGRCVMKPRDSNRSDSARVVSMPGAAAVVGLRVAGAAEIVLPTC